MYTYTVSLTPVTAIYNAEFMPALGFAEMEAAANVERIFLPLILLHTRRHISVARKQWPRSHTSRPTTYYSISHSYNNTILKALYSVFNCVCVRIYVCM